MSYEPESIDSASALDLRGILKKSKGFESGFRQSIVTQLYEYGFLNVRKETYTLKDEMRPPEEVDQKLALELGRDPEAVGLAIHHLARKGHDLPHVLDTSDIPDIVPFFDRETPVRVVDILHDGVEVECGQIPARSVLCRLGFEYAYMDSNESLFERTHDEVHLPVSVVHIPFSEESTYEVYIFEEGNESLGEPSMSSEEFAQKKSEPIRDFLNSR